MITSHEMVGVAEPSCFDLFNAHLKYYAIRRDD